MSPSGRVEDERRPHVRTERELAVGAAVADLERDGGGQGERLPLGAEEDAVLGRVRLVPAAAVLERRLDLDAHRHVAADGEDGSHEAALPHLARASDGHEVDHLGHALLGEEARDQDARVREVELAGLPALRRRREPVPPAARLVEDRAEYARAVEAIGAVPVDRALGADEGDRAQVADDPVLLDRQVVLHAHRSLVLEQ